MYFLKTTVNIMLNGEIFNAFTLRSGKWQDFLQLLLNISVLAISIRQEKEVK
jgi:hypothetical protein